MTDTATRPDTDADPATRTDSLGGPFGPPSAERHWLELASELAEDFAAGAAEIEALGDLPLDNLAALRTSGLDTALLPVEHGGGGMSMRAFGPVLGTIARACPSTACVWLMHVGAAYTLVALSEDSVAAEFAAAWRDGERFANALSEPASGNMFLVPMQAGVPTDGGWTLDGAKRFVSGCETADRFLINASIDGSPTFFGLDRDDTLSFTPIWDTMGMRATRSQLISLEGTLLREDRRCRAPGPGDGNPIGLGLPWLSIGVAEAAFGALAEHASGRVIPTTGKPLSHMQWVQFDAADEHVKIEAARLLAGKALWLADHASPETIGAAVEAKLYANQVARSVADLGVRIGGASGYLTTSPIQRHFRNAQAGWLMAYSVEVCRDFVGSRVLGAVDDTAGGFG